MIVLVKLSTKLIYHFLVVAAKINRASSKMNHWENMTNKLSEMKEVQLKAALKKEQNIQKKLDDAQKRQDELIKFNTEIRHANHDKKQQRRDRLYNKNRK